MADATNAVAHGRQFILDNLDKLCDFTVTVRAQDGDQELRIRSLASFCWTRPVSDGNSAPASVDVTIPVNSRGRFSLDEQFFNKFLLGGVSVQELFSNGNSARLVDLYAVFVKLGMLKYAAYLLKSLPDDFDAFGCFQDAFARYEEEPSDFAEAEISFNFSLSRALFNKLQKKKDSILKEDAFRAVRRWLYEKKLLFPFDKASEVAASSHRDYDGVDDEISPGPLDRLLGRDNTKALYNLGLQALVPELPGKASWYYYGHVELLFLCFRGVVKSFELVGKLGRSRRLKIKDVSYRGLQALVGLVYYGNVQGDFGVESADSNNKSLKSLFQLLRFACENHNEIMKDYVVAFLKSCDLSKDFFLPQLRESAPTAVLCPEGSLNSILRSWADQKKLSLNTLQYEIEKELRKLKEAELADLRAQLSATKVKLEQVQQREATEAAEKLVALESSLARTEATLAASEIEHEEALAECRKMHTTAHAQYKKKRDDEVAECKKKHAAELAAHTVKCVPSLKQKRTYMIALADCVHRHNAQLALQKSESAAALAACESKYQTALQKTLELGDRLTKTGREMELLTGNLEIHQSVIADLRSQLEEKTAEATQHLCEMEMLWNVVYSVLRKKATHKAICSAPETREASVAVVERFDEWTDDRFGAVRMQFLVLHRLDFLRLEIRTADCAAGIFVPVSFVV